MFLIFIDFSKNFRTTALGNKNELYIKIFAFHFLNYKQSSEVRDLCPRDVNRGLIPGSIECVLFPPHTTKEFIAHSLIK